MRHLARRADNAAHSIPLTYLCVTAMTLAALNIAAGVLYILGTVR